MKSSQAASPVGKAGQLRRKPPRSIAIAIAAFLVWSFAMMCVSFLLLSRHSSSPHVVSPAAVAEQSGFRLLDDLWPDNYQNEAMYNAIMFPCGHQEACVPEESPPTASKVALLYFPGQFASIFVDFIRACLRKHYSDEAEITQNVMFVPVSNLQLDSKKQESPFTHIIRFVNLPLLLAAGDALRSVGDDSEGDLQDIREVTRLLLDWHCRLSHYSAKIPVLNLSLESMAEANMETQESIRAFLGLPELDEEAFFEHENEEGAMDTSYAQLVESIQQYLERIEEGSSPKGGKNTRVVETAVEKVISDILSNGADAKSCPRRMDPIKSQSHLVERLLPFVSSRGKGYDVCDGTDTVARQVVCKVNQYPKFTAVDIQSSVRADQDVA